jgi:hypothetical protein
MDGSVETPASDKNIGRVLTSHRQVASRTLPWLSIADPLWQFGGIFRGLSDRSYRAAIRHWNRIVEAARPVGHFVWVFFWESAS